MSRTRIIKGVYNKITEGEHNIYSNKNIVTTAGKTLRETGTKNGIKHGDPKSPPPQTSTADCVVYFRTENSYNGEFGFDWLREDDKGLTSEPAYEKIIESGYSPKSLQLDKNGNHINGDLSKQDAFKKLKTEYERFTIVHNTSAQSATAGAKTSPTEYFIPYLTLFSKEFVNNTKFPSGATPPKYEATLRVLVDIKEDVDKLEFDFDKTLFSIDKTTLFDKSQTGVLKTGADKTITITCLKDLPNDKEIKVYAYPKGITAKPLATQVAARKLAGKIKVFKNDKTARKELKLVTANVKTNINGTKNIGKYGASDIQSLSNALHQMLTLPLITSGQDLNLSNDSNFQIKTDKTGNVTYGKFIYQNTNKNPNATDGNLYEDAKGIYDYVKDLYLQQNSQYKDYFTIFVFGEDSYDTYFDKNMSSWIGTVGQVQDIKIKNVFLFNGVQGNPRDSSTVAHECLHGLGLQHAHRDNTPIMEAERRYVFTKGTTDNYMAYFVTQQTLWKWQMDIARANV